MTNAVTAVPAAPSPEALDRFSRILSFETDCWDVHDAFAQADGLGFVLLDVRNPQAFAVGHIEGAINLPHGKIIGSKLKAFDQDTMFITYCAGPHCNGAVRGAARLAALGRPVKTMPGGITGWLDEGFKLVASEEKSA